MSIGPKADPGTVTGLVDVAPSEIAFDTEADPYRLFSAWYCQAVAAEPNDPNAMALATVDESGLPNVRMVLLKGLGSTDAGRPDGFLFYTNLESTKGRELAVNALGALVFHWKSLRRQVRLRGAISRVSDEAADAYFATRPRGSQIGAWASAQSRPLASRVTLAGAVAKVTARYGIETIPRPPHWSGFCLMPTEIEFWQSGQFRLHDRRQFTRTDALSSWQCQRLWP